MLYHYPKVGQSQSVPFAAAATGPSIITNFFDARLLQLRLLRLTCRRYQEVAECAELLCEAGVEKTHFGKLIIRWHLLRSPLAENSVKNHLQNFSHRTQMSEQQSTGGRVSVGELLTASTKSKTTRNKVKQ